MLKDILKQKDYLPILKMSDGTAVTKENWEKRKKSFSLLFTNIPTVLHPTFP